MKASGSICIINSSQEVVSIIPEYIDLTSRIEAAKQHVLDAAKRGEKLTAIDENNESVFDCDFEMFLQFVPHARRIAAGLMDKMAQEPSYLHMLLSDSPKMGEVIATAITDYFQKQIAFGAEYLAMSEEDRTTFRERIFGLLYPTAA